MPRARIKLASILAAGLALLSASTAMIAEEGISYFTLDEFESSRVGQFPRRWRTWPFQRGEAEKVYRVAEEGGRRFIKAYDDHDASQQIFFNFDWPLHNMPNLTWRWRATMLPAGADESNDTMNDSACGVYVVIGRYSGHAIKYVWSTALSPGSVVTRRGGKLKIKVLDSGNARTGSWAGHTVDVSTDYKALFGRPLDKNPSGIGILTDGNAVHRPAGCDYSDFVISK